VIEATTIADAVDVTSLRLGWFASFRAMLAWDLGDLRLQLPVLVAVQLLGGVGFVLGFGLFFRHLPEHLALYVATGLPVINLITFGAVVFPQYIASQKLDQTYDYLSSLPVRRAVRVGTAFVTTLVVGLPAVVATLLVATAHYHLHLDVSLEVVPALLFVALSGTMLGLALGHAIDRPTLAQSLSQLLIFAIFGFCPIVFPSAHLPGWLAGINSVLPFESMATMVRGGLTSGLVSDLGRAYAVVAAWTVVSAAVVAWAMGRRR
jgi:ABC-2 type transport system permease protein